MTTHAFVFARGGSKGVPRKNLAIADGIPLITYSLRVAHEISEISGTFVSTDDGEIAHVAAQEGATVIERPPSLADDASPEWLSWQHAVRWVQSELGDFSTFVSLPATAPLRRADDVRQCLQAIVDGIDIVLTMTEASHSPWFNMVQADEDRRIKLILADEGRIARRQDAPKAYNLTTVAYVARPEFILSGDGLWSGRARGVEVPAERALDIDTPLDLQMAEHFLRRRRLRRESAC